MNDYPTLLGRGLSKTLWPTMALRFVIRDGKRILQQGWHADDGTHEWRDVPLHDDEQPADGGGEGR